MRLASYEVNGQASWGAVVEGGVVDMKRRFPEWASLRDMLQADGLAKVAAAVSTASVDLRDGFAWAPVIPNPGQIICVGLNYEAHRLEAKRERVGYPTIFARTASSQVGHGRPLVRPVESTQFDYEGELAVVIGRRCRRVGREEAYGVIAGYACYNDGSIRDFQLHASQFHPGKNFPRSGAFGPWMTTPDEVGDVTELELVTRLNGEQVQRAKLDQMIFDIPELIAYVSMWTELEPGDVIVTGTPGGIGMARKPPLWMKAGDLVEVEISRIGTLTNTVVDEA